MKKLCFYLILFMLYVGTYAQTEHKLSGFNTTTGQYIDNVFKITRHTSSPTVNDDVDLGYREGNIWVNVTGDSAFILVDTTDGAAVWHTINIVDSTFVKLFTDSIQGLNGDSVYVNSDLIVDNKLIGKVLVSSPTTSLAITAVTDSLISDFTCIEVVPDADYVLTSTPTIPNGVNGQWLLIHNTSSFTLDIQDEAILVGSNVLLDGAEGTVKPQGAMLLTFSTSTGKWGVLSNPNQASIGATANLLPVRNTSGSGISAGKAVYITGYNVGQARPTIDLADADDATKRPSIGVTAAAIGNNANGQVISFGNVIGLINTVGTSVNDPVYLDTAAGEVVFARPNIDGIQKLGHVTRVNASGNIMIFGAGRMNDVPIDFTAKTITLDSTKGGNEDTIFLLSSWLIKTLNGIDLIPGSDVDHDWITSSVTNNPKIFWDESNKAITIQTDDWGRLALNAVAVTDAILSFHQNLGQRARIQYDQSDALLRFIVGSGGTTNTVMGLVTDGEIKIFNEGETNPTVTANSVSVYVTDAGGAGTASWNMETEDGTTIVLADTTQMKNLRLSGNMGIGVPPSANDWDLFCMEGTRAANFNGMYVKNLAADGVTRFNLGMTLAETDLGLLTQYDGASGIALVLNRKATIGEYWVGTPGGYLRILNSGTVQLGDDSVNYVAVTQTGDVTFHGDARYTRHHDIVVGAATVGSTAPTPTTVGTFRGLAFDADNEVAHFAVEVPSEWDTTTDMTLVVHWFSQTGDIIQNGETVKWDATYRVATEGDSIDHGTVVVATTTFTGGASEKENEHYMTSITLDRNDANQPFIIGSDIGVQFDRDVGVDTYSGDGIIYKWDLVYTARKLGSH